MKSSERTSTTEVLQLAEELDDISDRLREQAEAGNMTNAKHDEISGLIERLGNACPNDENGESDKREKDGTG